MQASLKQQVHELVDELPEDSATLDEIFETLRLNQALGEAYEDVEAGRVMESDKFMRQVEQRWPRNSTA